MPMVTVQIDPSACILAANCVGIEPKLFQIGQESYVELIDANGAVHGTEYTLAVTEAELEVIEEAVDSCPTRATSMQSVMEHLGVSWLPEPACWAGTAYVAAASAFVRHGPGVASVAGVI